MTTFEPPNHPEHEGIDAFPGIGTYKIIWIFHYFWNSVQSVVVWKMSRWHAMSKLADMCQNNSWLRPDHEKVLTDKLLPSAL